MQEKAMNFGLDPSDDNMDQLHDVVADLSNLSGSITLIGPEAMQRSAESVIDAAGMLEGALYARPPRDDGLYEISEESAEAYSLLFNLRTTFVSAAREVLGAA
ncbi:hypothetical protein [Streptomyces sp. NPDC020681]|uniref:hypothetical protein n=1 Tax=Streptomyces sp. NPDC020681 TaxID=3365083 RepID=UPI0037BDA0DE